MSATTWRPASVPEWDAEDMFEGTLGDEAWPADEQAARAMLDEVRIELPAELQHTDLESFAGERSTPLDETLRADVRQHSFHLVGLPVPVVVPEDRRLVRLRLRLTLGDGAVAWDVFPRTEWVAETHDVATVSVDVGNALAFVSPPLAGALGLNLDVPLRYTAHHARMQSSGPNSNPVEWLVRGDELRDGFTAYLIVRGERAAPVELRAELACELRRRNVLGRLLRATYVSDAERYECSTS